MKNIKSFESFEIKEGFFTRKDKDNDKNILINKILSEQGTKYDQRLDKKIYCTTLLFICTSMYAVIFLLFFDVRDYCGHLIQSNCITYSNK